MSRNPMDVALRYCGNCRNFHEPPVKLQSLQNPQN